MVTQTKLVQLKETFSKYREDTSMEVSQMQAWAEDVERKVGGVSGEIPIAKTVALSEYQSLAELEQARANNFDEGVRTFIYNVWR